jgi:hypothetical protein
MVAHHALSGNSAPTDTNTNGDGFTPTGRIVKARPVKWLWPGFLPYGAVSVLEASKGAGKSTILAALAAYMTGGPPLPGCRKLRRGGTVVYLTREEDYRREVLPRVQLAGGDPHLLRFPQLKDGKRPAPLRFPDDLEKLAEIIRKHKSGLTLIDPITSFFSEGYGPNEELAMRGVLEPLAELAVDLEAAILFTRHWRKDKGGDAQARGMGSTAIAAVCRSQLQVGVVKDQPGLRAVVRAAGNWGAAPPARGFHLVGDGDLARIEWEGQLDIDAEDLDSSQVDAGDRAQRKDARTFLMEFLKNERQTSTEVIRVGRGWGIGERTLWLVKAALKIATEKKKEGEKLVSYWVKPVGGFPK